MIRLIRYSLIVFVIITALISSLKYLTKLKANEVAQNKFIENIKRGINNQVIDSNHFREFKGYSIDALRRKKVINVSTNRELALDEILKNPNYFVNFWFKGCVGCEEEMPEIEAFYKKYNNKIAFLIISNDNLQTVQEYKRKHNYTLPFYIFKDDTFPIGINIFPTSHLVLDNKTQFLYAGVGYYDNIHFYKYIDSALLNKVVLTK